MPQISYDSRALRIDDQRTLVFSGAIHYPRSTPATWPLLMQRSKAAGLNTIETYVFWNLHERKQGVYDFSERLDLPRFCQLAKDHGLNMILRIGPYICAETNYGGLPPWLRDIPGMRPRTCNEPFMREMGRWVRHLCGILRPHFAPSGGPIILAQLENEYNNVAKNYGEEGQKYLQWCVQLGKEIQLGVPLVMCCGASEGAMETINGFYAHQHLEQHWKDHPDQPAIWTENWPSWYDVFGYSHHVRTPEDVAYGVARFFAAGGVGVNYYMWHGGTNFGRESMYLQTTSYDFGAPLDEFGLLSTKGSHLSRLHGILQQHASLLLSSERPQRQPLGEKQGAYVYRDGGQSLAFLCNDDEEQPASLAFEGASYDLPPHSVVLLGNGRLLMHTGKIIKADIVERKMQPLRGAMQQIQSWPEPMPAKWPAELRSPTVCKQPIEQLQLTHDQSDYCWYTTTIKLSARAAGKGTLTLMRAADVVHVFIDGRLQATTLTPLMENRGPVDGDTFKQTFELKLPPGKHELSLLCCAVGMVKGDWMLGMTNMSNERKGLWGDVLWNGKALSGWSIQPGTVGERCQVWAAGGALVNWKEGAKSAAAKPLRWWRMNFSRPKGDAPLTVDLGGMTKGLAWLNGRCIGRYWLAPAAGRNPISPARKPILVPDMTGQPTQRYYHLPAEWLAEKNTLVLFEEQGGDAASIRLCQSK